MSTLFTAIHDLVDQSDPQGRTYKQVNAEKVHRIPVGTLVEVVSTGVRAFVVKHSRDCDMTPHYYLSMRQDDIGKTATECGSIGEGFRPSHWSGGWPEHSLKAARKSKKIHP